MKKTIVITGAAGNLGKSVTANLLRDGYSIQAALGPNDSLDFMEHSNLVSNKVNLLDEEASEIYINEILFDDGVEIEALVCLVGGFTMGTIENTTSSSIQKMVDLNFKTVYHMVRPLVNQYKLLGKSLKIILVGSRPGLEPFEGKDLLAYGISKSMVFRLAEYINENTNETDISASVIVPSTLDTPGTRNAMPDVDPTHLVPVDKVSRTIAFILSNTGAMMRNTVYKLYNKA